MRAPTGYTEEMLFEETDWFSSRGDVLLRQRVLSDGRVEQYGLFFTRRWWYLSRAEIIELADEVHRMMSRTAGSFSMRFSNCIVEVVPRAARRLLKAAAIVDNTVRDIPIGPYR